MLEIKEKNQLIFDNVNNYIGVPYNSDYIFISEKSALENACLISKQMVKRIHKYNDYTKMIQDEIIANFDTVNKNIITWLQENLQIDFNKIFKLDTFDDKIFFIEEILLITIYNNIFLYLHDYLTEKYSSDIKFDNFNNFLELIKFKNYVFNNSKVWDTDILGDNNLDITYQNHPFLAGDFEFNKNDIVFIKRVLISMLEEHINSKSIFTIKFQTPIQVGNDYYIFKTSTFFGVCYSELINNYVYSDSYFGIPKCKWCGKRFIKEEKNHKYCSEKCKKEAIKEADRKYNESKRGKERTERFNRKNKGTSF